jgi:undecaprenyl-diphosphatase
MNIIQIIVLAIIQGLAELLPVSSSAHVIVAEKLMGLDPASPEMSFLLVMLHTGTMFAVLIYFWSRWKDLIRYWPQMVLATICTGIVGLGLQQVIQRFFLRNHGQAEIEQLFGNLPLIAISLAAAGVLIIIAGFKEERAGAHSDISYRDSILIGMAQGVCLPFRGLSRSGTTISTALLLNIARTRAEEFSFALAVILTPPVIARELYRLVKHHAAGSVTSAIPLHLFAPGLLGMLFSFAAGLVALKWLSSWLEEGKWKYFGFYCLVASAVVLVVHFTLSR